MFIAGENQFVISFSDEAIKETRERSQTHLKWLRIRSHSGERSSSENVFCALAGVTNAFKRESHE